MKFAKRIVGCCWLYEKEEWIETILSFDSSDTFLLFKLRDFISRSRFLV